MPADAAGRTPEEQYRTFNRAARRDVGGIHLEIDADGGAVVRERCLARLGDVTGVRVPAIYGSARKTPQR